jgi:hypothetical protein
MSGTFDGFRQQSLVRRADTADPPGQNLSSFGNKMAQELAIFEIDISNLFSTKLADSLAPNTEPLWTWHRILAFLS